MSTTGWVYVPASSGAGHLQRVASNTEFNRTQRAYIDHSRDCQTCAVDSTACTTAEELWGIYRAAMSP
ncbi:hypothetical protein [Streptomyces sp. NBC_00019]|uniref:hypothetical protein n=1 Tax=Streptomyces sp. NBC_00019 TaxID=2975623 RepID=UPI003248A744